MERETKSGDTGPWRPGGAALWLHPDDDLAPNRPGEIPRGRLAARVDGRAAIRRRLALGRLLGRPAVVGVWRARLTGEQLAGAGLDRLAIGGWRILHSIPLPGDSDLSHLAIGPGGVFGFRTVFHGSARVRVGEDSVRTGNRRSEPDTRISRRNAQRAAHALTRGCGFRVEVRPVLVCVAAAYLTVDPALRDVQVLRDVDLGTFHGRGGVLRPDRIEAIHGVARDRRTWRDV